MKQFAKMFESIKAKSQPIAGRRTVYQELCVAKLTDRDDTEDYLTTFEHLMLAYNVP